MNTVSQCAALSAPANKALELTEDQLERLALILDELLSVAESGAVPDVVAACQQAPDLAESIRYYMRSLQLLQQITVPERRGQGETQSSKNELGELGDFKLLREIGRGGMGIVYEAHQKSLARHVAVKTLPFAAVLDPRQIARFQNEAQAAASLHHPNIVPVFSVGNDRGTHFYSMQYVDGTSLDHVIDQLKNSSNGILSPREKQRMRSTCDEPAGSPLSHNSSATINSIACGSTIVSIRTSHDVQNIVRLIIQAAQALHYAHQHGIVHRDIKPSNLLVNNEGKLWVTDFGLAQCRMDTRDSRQTNLTRSGDFLGTLKYMSPEQAVGKPHLVDHRTDIYSLGVTLYELLTLKSVVDGTDHLAMIQQISQVAPIDPRRLNAAIPISLETIILKSLAKSREDRYNSAEEFAEDLQRYLAGQVPRAKRPTWIDHSARLVKQYPKIIASSMIALVLLLACSLAFASIVNRKNQQIASARERANHHLAIANEVVNRFGPMQLRKLELLAGSDEVRLSLAREAVEYFESFVSYASNDPLMQRDVANALLICSDLELQSGKSQSAIAHYQRAIPILDSLLKSTRKDSPLQIDLAICRNNLAVACFRMGDLENAQLHLEKCLADLLASSIYEVDAMQKSVCEALTRLNLGHVAVEREDLHRAKSEFAKAIALSERIQAEPAVTTRNGSSIGNATGSLLVAAMLEASQLPQIPAAQSQRLIELAIQKAERLIVSDVDSQRPALELGLVHAMSVRDLNICRLTLGAHLVNRGETADARLVFQKTVCDSQKLQSLHPLVIQFALDYATALNNLGQCELELKNLDEAERILGQSHDQLVKILQASGGYQSLSALGSVLHNLSMVSELKGDHQTSINRIQQALEYQEQALHKAPSSERCAQMMQQHRHQLVHLEKKSTEPIIKQP